MKYSSGIHFLVFFFLLLFGWGEAFALSLIIAFKAALCHLLSLNKKEKNGEGGGWRRNKGYNHLGERRQIKYCVPTFRSGVPRAYIFMLV